MSFTQDFNQDLNVLFFRIKSNYRFALNRFADGERSFCAGYKLHRTADKWKYDGDDTPFALAMREALNYVAEAYSLGLPCPCCDRKGHDWYMATVPTPLKNITYSNLMVNGNYARFKQFAEEQKLLDRCELVGCTDRATIKVPVNAINPPFDYAETLDKMKEANRPILVAAGPLTCVLIYQYWKDTTLAKRQWILDVGSALDVQCKNRTTRRYQRQGSLTSRKVCTWHVAAPS